MTITTDPDNPEWFFVKFRQPGPPVSAASAPTPSSAWSTAGTTATGGPSNTTSSGWSFVSVQAIGSPDEGSVILYGNMINDSGSAQEISSLTGIFYDQFGRRTNLTQDYWPIEVVPPGGQVPFELTVYNAYSLQSYSLSVIAQPSSETPRQDFEFLNLDTFDDRGDYCVAGELRNPGDELQEYLVIAAVLYNDQGDVINFDSYNDDSPEGVVGDQTADFEICVDTHQQEVARYELRAWGY
jgi:hypothetical protein